MNRSRQKFVDALFVGVFVIYLLAGMMLAPFHGDESTIIHKAVDWYTLTQAHNLPAILYNPAIQDAGQSLRIQDGVVSSYAMGLASTLIGLPASALPSMWDWQADWNYNVSSGHMPTQLVLFVSRLSSTLMTAVSVALVFAIARRIGRREAAWIATALYTLMPAVLLDGRRAMFEGATLLSAGLVILAGLHVARHIRAEQHTQRHRGRDWLLFGAAAGFGMASKHNLALTIIPVMLVLLWIGRWQLRRTIIYGTASTVTAIIVFLALNPTWWGAPLVVPGEVLRLRKALSDGQASYFGGYTNTLDRVVALYAMPTNPPQYYEDTHGWPDWIGGEIVAYESAGLAGLGWNQAVSLLIGVLATVVWLLPGVQRPHGNEALVYFVVMIFSMLATFAIIPLPWQRYYLPLSALWAVYYALAGVAAWRWLARFSRQIRVGYA